MNFARDMGLFRHRLIWLFALLALLLPATVLAAAELQPPSSVSVSDIKVFGDLAEDGDMLYVFEYDIAYNSDNYPTEAPASDSFIFRLYDGETLRATDIPYVYPYFYSYGYGNGVGAFYFAASDNKPAWGDNLTINIYGWPLYFGEAQSYDFSIDANNYIDASSQDTNRAELKSYILLLADRLFIAYEDSRVILKTSTDSGIMLSSYGEMYFQGAIIDDLQSLCPQLFFIQSYIPEKMTVQEYNMSLGELYGETIEGTDIEEGLTNIGGAIGGTSAAVTATLIFIVAMMATCILVVKKGWGIEAGFAISALEGILAAIILGNALFTLLMIASLAAGGSIMWLVFLKKA